MRVMLQHSTEREITESCLECLSKLCSDPQTADKIFHFISNQFMPSVHPCEKVSSPMIELISRLTEYPHLLEQMETYLCNKVVAFVELHHLEDWAVILPSLKVCERLCDEETFLQCSFDRSTVVSLLKIFEKSCNEWKDVQSSNLIGFLVTRILLTLLEKKDGVKKIIKDNGGQDLYGIYVDGNEGDQKTNALAVRLLHKLFDDMPLQSLLSNIKANKFKDKNEKNLQILVALISEKEQLVESIGNDFMRSLLQAFGDRKTSKISAIHISKFFSIASKRKSAANCLVDIPPVQHSRILCSDATSQDIIINCLDSIQSIITSASSDCNKFIRGIDSSVIETLHIFKEKRGIIKSALQCLTIIEEKREERQLLLSTYEDYALVVFHSMIQHSCDNDIQHYGSKILLKLLSLQRFADSFTGGLVNEFLSLAILNVRIHKVDPDVLLLSLRNIQQIVVYNSYSGVKADFDDILNSLAYAVRTLHTSSDCFNVAQQIIHGIGTEDFIQDKKVDILSTVEQNYQQHLFMEIEDLEHALAKTQLLVLFGMHDEVDNNHFTLLIKLAQTILRLNAPFVSLLPVLSTMNQILERTSVSSLCMDDVSVIHIVTEILGSEAKFDSKIVHHSMRLILSTLHCQSKTSIQGLEGEILIEVFGLHMEDDLVISSIFDLFLFAFSHELSLDLMRKGSIIYLNKLVRSKSNDLTLGLEFVNEVARRKEDIDLPLTFQAQIIDICFSARRDSRNIEFRVAIDEVVTFLLSEDRIALFDEKIKKAHSGAEHMTMRELEKVLYEYRLWISHCEYSHESYQIFLLLFDLLISDKSKTTKRRLLPEATLLGIQIVASPLVSLECIQDHVSQLFSIVFDELEKSPTYSLCASFFCMIQNEYAMDIVNEEYEIEFIPILISLLQKGRIDNFGSIIINSCRVIIDSESDAVQSFEECEGVIHVSKHILATMEEVHADNSHICDSFELLIMIGKTNPALLAHDALFDLIMEILSRGCETNTFKSISRLLSVIAATDIGARKIEENELVRILVNSFLSLHKRWKKYSDYEQIVGGLGIVITSFCKKESLFLLLHDTVLVDELNAIVETSACPMILRLLHLLESKKATSTENLKNDLAQLLEVMNKSQGNKKKAGQMIKCCCESITLLDKESGKEATEALGILQKMFPAAKRLHGTFRQQMVCGCFSILRMLIPIVSIDEHLMRFFLTQCNNVLNERILDHLWTVISCINAFIVKRVGLDLLLRDIRLLNSLKNIIPLPIRMRNQPLQNEELLPDQINAFDFFRRLALGIGKYLHDLVQTVEGLRDAVGFFCHAPISCVTLVFENMKTKDSSSLALVLLAVLMKSERNENQVRCVITILFKILNGGVEEKDFSPAEIKTIVGASILCPGPGLILMKKVSSSKHGASSIINVEGCIGTLETILSTHRHFAKRVTSIFASCISEFADSNKLIESMKDTDIPLQLGRYLSEPNRVPGSDPIFVTDALKVIWNLLSTRINSNNLNMDNHVFRSIDALYVSNADAAKFKTDILVALRRRNLVKVSSISSQVRDSTGHDELVTTNENACERTLITVTEELLLKEKHQDSVKSNLEEMLQLLGGLEDCEHLISTCPSIVTEISVLLFHYSAIADIVTCIIKLCGIFTICDKICLEMVRNKIPGLICDAVSQFQQEKMLMVLSLKVLANIGSCSHLDDDIVPELIRQGCLSHILLFMDRFKSDVMGIQVAFQCIYNLDGGIGIESLRQNKCDVLKNILNKILDTSEAHHYDQDLMHLSIRAISLFTLSNDTLVLLSDLRGISFLVGVITSYLQHGEQIVEGAVLCLANMIGFMPKGVEELINLKGLSVLERCLALNSRRLLTCKCIMSIYATILRQRDTLEDIAYHQVYALKIATEFHFSDITCISYFVEIAAQLSKKEEFISAMVQSGCISLLLLTFDKVPENEILRTALLKIFCNIMQTSNDGKSVLICLGLKLTLEKTLCTAVQRDLRHFVCKTLAMIHCEGEIVDIQKVDLEKTSLDKVSSLSRLQV